MRKTAMVLRTTARALSVPIVLLWAFLVIAYAIEPERSLPGNLDESIAYVALIVSFLALVVSWRWEFVGSTVTLVAVAVGATINWRGLLSLNIIIPIDAVLFLLSWWLNRNAQQE